MKRNLAMKKTLILTLSLTLLLLNMKKTIKKAGRKVGVTKYLKITDFLSDFCKLHQDQES
jgi:hypothetical protein